MGSQLRFIDILDGEAFGLVPPCADPRFDHRTCDYWEDADRGSKAARPSWLAAAGSSNKPERGAIPASDNPFAPASRASDNPFAPPPRDANPFASASATGSSSSQARSAALSALAGEGDEGAAWNPFAPTAGRPAHKTDGLPRKLALLLRGRDVFGSYAKIALHADDPVAWTQFGPLSAYPRASRLRELYPQLPDSPLPAVISCIATTEEARRHGHARALIAEVCRDLAGRGFSAVEAYPDLTQRDDETSAARPPFWLECGFRVAVDDDRFPVMRRELD
jgi:hypothetical protein